MRNWTWLIFSFLVLMNFSQRGMTDEPVETSPALEPAREELPSDKVNFFETRIRPALIQHCYDCHSTDTEASGGLLLDSRDGMLAGGDSGSLVQPGNADTSRLIRAISYADPRLQMPPDGKLDPQTIADFRIWVDQGAIDPRSGDSPTPITPTDPSIRDGSQHWAYQPLPAVSSLSVGLDLPPGQAIDWWIDHQLSAKGLLPAGRAEPAVLVRRLYFDLIGLPPTTDQLNEAVQEICNGRIEVLVDRLLASPHFGEAQARRWMDVVRYADSITLRGILLPEAWRYRDYLIQSFNRDLSFATMTRQQIAGDLMEADDLDVRTQQLVATAFLTLGNTNLEKQDKTQLDMDYLDEQLDVLGSAFLGQTIGCARCHDHKFDPIPTRDYYAMAGILRSSTGMEHDNVSKVIELPLPLDEFQTAYFAELDDQRKLIEQKIKDLKVSIDPNATSQKLVAIDKLPGVVLDNADAKLVGQWISSTHTRPLVGSDYIHDADEGKGEKSVTFEPKLLPPGEYLVRLAYQPGNNRASRVIAKVFSADGDTEVLIDQRKPPPEDGLWINLGRYRFEENGQAYVLIGNADTDGHVILDAVQFLPVSVLPLSGSADPTGAPGSVESSSTPTGIDKTKRDIQNLEKQLAEVQSSLKLRPKYLTVREGGSAADIPVHIRGSVHSLGETVPRGFLTAMDVARAPEIAHDSVSHVQPGLPVDTPGPSRLELALWITEDANSLTARVYANRLWLWMMGRGIVETPNNFGTTGQPPTHPELLDWLAVRLIDSGWSTKAVIRDIVLSRAYQRALLIGDQNSDQHGDEIDSDNRYYWRGQARRLTVESLRDAMLMVSGHLDTTMGGSLIRSGTQSDYDYDHRSMRRAIYQPVFRNSLPELFEQFDFADPSTSIGKRSRSTISPQGLSLANNPWIIECSAHAAKRWVQRTGEVGLESSLQELFLSCFSRLPTEEELQLGLEFVSRNSGDRNVDQSRMQILIQTLFASIDFRFLE